MNTLSAPVTKRATFDLVAPAGTINDPFFRLVKKDTGMGVSQSSGSLLITTGTTAYEELLLRSTSFYNDSMMLRYALALSQRIANQNFVVELVDVIGDDLACVVNSSTEIVVTLPDNNTFTAANIGQFVKVCNIKNIASAPVGRYAISAVSGNNITLTVSGWPASGGCTVSLVGWNYNQVLYSGTNATNCTFDVQRNGYNAGSSTATISTTASPGHIAYVSVEDGRSTLSDEVSPGGTPTQRLTRARSVTDGYTRNLYVQIHVYNGTTNPASTTTATFGFVQMDTYNPLQVNITSSSVQGSNGGLPVSGTVSVQNTSNGSLVVEGVVAHDSPISGRPVRVGGRAVTSNYTAVTTGDTADIITTTVGVQVNKLFSIPEVDWTYAAAASGISNTTTAVTVKAAAAAGIRNYITGLSVSAGTLGSATELVIRDGAAGTVLWRHQLQTTGVPVVNIQFPTPLRGTAATLLEVATLTAATGNVYINLQGYAAP